jgi:hypothetical protein
MRRLFPAGVAELLRFHAFGMLFLVLGRGVIAIFAIPALQRNNVSHKLSFTLRNRFIEAEGLPLRPHQVIPCSIQ